MALRTKLDRSIEKDRKVRLRSSTTTFPPEESGSGQPTRKKKGFLKLARQIPQESDIGYIEYKWKICDFKDEDFRKEKLASQMTFRLFEGEGKAVYNIGFTDDGRPVGLTYEKMLQSLRHFKQICDEVGGIIRSTKIFQGSEEKFYCANIYIEKELDPKPGLECHEIHADFD